MKIQWRSQNIVGCGIYSASPYKIVVTAPSPSARMSTLTVPDAVFSVEASKTRLAARLEGPELLEGHVNVRQRET